MLLTFDLYFTDPLYVAKKPNPDNPKGDNIYEPLGIGRFRQLPNPAHDDRHCAHDLGVNRVMISLEFYYFGSAAPQLPATLAPIVHTTQGHLRIRPERDDPRYQHFLLFLEWLKSYAPGIHAVPTLEEIICVPPEEDESDD